MDMTHVWTWQHKDSLSLKHGENVYCHENIRVKKKKNVMTEWCFFKTNLVFLLRSLVIPPLIPLGFCLYYLVNDDRWDFQKYKRNTSAHDSLNLQANKMKYHVTFEISIPLFQTSLYNFRIVAFYWFTARCGFFTQFAWWNKIFKSSALSTVLGKVDKIITLFLVGMHIDATC